jgi:hypothetical protein
MCSCLSYYMQLIISNTFLFHSLFIQKINCGNNIQLCSNLIGKKSTFIYNIFFVKIFGVSMFHGEMR